MMKFLQLPRLICTASVCAAALVASVSFSACGGGKKSSGKPGEKSSAAADVDLSDAAGQAVIEFHNKLLETIIKDVREPLRKIGQEAKASLDWVERSTVVSAKPKWNLVLLGPSPLKRASESKLKAPSKLPKDQQEFFNTRIEILKKTAAELNTNVDTLKAYYKAEDYKDDKHQKAKDLAPKIMEQIGTIHKNGGEIMERSEQLATAAERKALEKIPQGIYILNMRDIMAKVEEQCATLTDKRLLSADSRTSSTKESKAADVAKVKDLTDTLEKQAAELKEMSDKMRAIKTDKLSKTLAKRYEAFFKTLDDQQGTYRAKLRFVKEFGYAGNESDMRLLQDAARKVITAHNNFIEAANEGR